MLEPRRESTPSDSRRPSQGMALIFQEPLPYPVGWEMQSRLHTQRVLDFAPDTVLFLEHQPVYTLGRSAHPSHWGGNETSLCEKGAELHHVNRGGSVTYHGPGQIVVYPIVRLVQHATGPRQLVWLLEEVIIRMLRRWKIDGRRIEKKPGVWVMTPEPAKIASIGIRVERGVTLHGFALNVDMDLSPFLQIHPCGLTDCHVASMAALLNTALPVQSIKHDLAHVFSDVFSVEWLTVKELSGGRDITIDEKTVIRT